MPYRPTGRPPGRPRHPEPLTPAEQRVLRYLRQGKTNAEIADELDVSPDAVKYHVSNMLGKLELESREQLAAWREPSPVARVWAAMGGLGWKLAGSAAALLAATGVGLGGWLLLRGGGPGSEPTDLTNLATGVLSIGIDGQPANGPSMNPSISDDGRFVAFESEATNLVKGDTNGVSDIFVVDRADRSIRRVSMAPGGKEANGASHRPAISGDGKWVAFDSEASNLVKGDVNGELDRVVALVPQDTAVLIAAGRPDITADSVGGSDVFIVRLATGNTELVSTTSSGEPANLGSYAPSISRDGRFVAFESASPNLVGVPATQFPGAGINPVLASDVFLRDRAEKTTVRVSKRAGGQPGATASGRAAVSADGSVVAFVSAFPDLAGIVGYQVRSLYVWSQSSAEVQLVPLPPAPPNTDGVLFPAEISQPALTSTGGVVGFSMTASASKRPDPTGVQVNGVYVYTKGDPEAALVPESADASQFGRVVSFTSDAHELLFQTIVNQKFALSSYDLASGLSSAEPLSAGTEPATPVVSGDGRWVAAVQDSGGKTPTGIPLFQVIVFPR